MTTRKGELMAAELEAKRRSGSPWGELDFFQRGPGRTESRSCAFRFFSAVLITSAVFVLLTYTLLFVSGFRTAGGWTIDQGQSSSGKTSSVPEYFQTSPKLYAGGLSSWMC
jgi:hypothetical protein